MEFYSLGNKVIAFTTDRTQGRDAVKIQEQLNHYAAEHRLPLSADANRFVYPHQTHTDRVARITDDLFSKTIPERKAILEGIDAVTSNEPHAIIGISTADCIPVVVYDAEHHAAAAIHAGWKGTVKRIVEKAIAEMKQAYGTNPAQCTAFIGPGISQDSFEVGQEVVDKFTEAGFQMTDYTIEMPDMHGREGKRPHIDLKEINRQQLLSQGVLAENITVSDIDTYTDNRFFSARREQQPPLPDGTVVKCGRILSGFILL